MPTLSKSMSATLLVQTAELYETNLFVRSALSLPLASCSQELVIDQLSTDNVNFQRVSYIGFLR